MKQKINSINAYYNNLNKLILECVNPLMENFSNELEIWFWERSCIGGKHLKLRWVEKTENSAIKTEIIRQITGFQQAYPSPASDSYHPSAVKRLVETEKRNVSEDELEYRVDCVLEKPYERLPDDDMSENLMEVLHYFLNDTRDFCSRIIASDIDRTLLGMQLLAVFSCNQFGSLDNGCITFRAHWDNYENWFKPEILPQKIKAHYQTNKEHLHEIVGEILKQHENQTFNENPIFAEWLKIIEKYRTSVYQKQSENVVFMPAPTTVEGVVATANYLGKQDTKTRSEEFLKHLYSQPEYLGNLSFNKGLQMTRIMVNLVYHIISNLGISAFQRMSYCYFLHRSVEEILDIDLINTLDKTMKHVLSNKENFESSAFGMEDLT